MYIVLESIHDTTSNVNVLFENIQDIVYEKQDEETSTEMNNEFVVLL